MKVEELRQKDITGLENELRELLREQFNLRMQNIGQGPKTNQGGRLKHVRRDIARVKTIIREKVRKS